MKIFHFLAFGEVQTLRFLEFAHHQSRQYLGCDKVSGSGLIICIRVSVIPVEGDPGGNMLSKPKLSPGFLSRERWTGMYCRPTMAAVGWE